MILFIISVLLIRVTKMSFPRTSVPTWNRTHCSNYIHNFLMELIFFCPECLVFSSRFCLIFFVIYNFGKTYCITPVWGFHYSSLGSLVWDYKNQLFIYLVRNTATPCQMPKKRKIEIN